MTMCLACEQDAMWIAYLESQGLLKDDDPAAVEALFGAFPVQPLPFQAGEAERQETVSAEAKSKAANAASNPFSCDDPTGQ
jgi:hypothetical protein